jgi:probable HAF family extracellular repeat protein
VLAAAALVFGCGQTAARDPALSGSTPASGPGIPGHTALLVVDISVGQGSVRVAGFSAAAATTVMCVEHCELHLDEGSTATLYSDPNLGWLLDSWGGACGGLTTGLKPCSIQIGGRQMVTAQFKRALPPNGIIYNLTDLSQLGGPNTVTDAQALDDNGAVAGRICDSPPFCSSFTWDVFRWDGTLHRFRIPPRTRAWVAATSAGRVAGTLQNEQGAQSAFISASDSFVELETLGGNSRVNAMNASGIVVGVSVTSSGEPHAVTWKEGRVFDLGAQTGKSESVAMAIDDSGRIGVLACDHLAPRSGCRGMIMTDSDTLDLGALPDSLDPSAMSVQGHVVGFVPGAHAAHAAVWIAGQMTDLDGEIAARPWPSLGIYAGSQLQSGLGAVAASGDAVGAAIIPISEGGAATAILWKDGQLVDLVGAVDPPTRLHSASAINARGQILARRTELGFTAVLLTPP